MSDPAELANTTQDTVQIFYHFVRLNKSPEVAGHTVAATGNATEQPSNTTLAVPRNTETTISARSTTPCACTAEKEASPVATSPAPMPTVKTLVRSKSRDASRKEPHPKAAFAVNCSILDRPAGHESASSEGGNSVSHSPKTSSSPKSRPEKLVIASVLPVKHQRMTSSQSDCSGKTTPAQDPPMDSEVLSPIAAELTSLSYPPMSSSCLQSSEPCSSRVGLTTHTVAAPSSDPGPSCTALEFDCGQLRHQRAPCTVAQATKAQDTKARMIADQLKIIGDKLEDEVIKSKLDDLTESISNVVLSNNPVQLIMTYICNDSSTNLSWRKVAELFKLLYRVMEEHPPDQFTLFEKVWHCLLDRVVPWIQEHGGWMAFLRANDSDRPANTPSIGRRRHPLEPASSEPVLPYLTSSTQQGQLSCAASRGYTDNHAQVKGRMAYTPQMPRRSYHEQSSPALVGQSEPRHRLWSLTESGSFKRDDGVEDIEKSISEFDLTDGEESETFENSQEEVEAEEGGGQEVNQTLTSDRIRSGLSSNSSCSSFNNSSSPPITVPSPPHFSSQPETVSIDELTFDSGVENLSLSCSPPRVSFTVGGANSRHSPMMHTRYQTSLTSLSSAASASPVHTSPSSRKNSSSNINSYFASKPRPRSGGSLKESRSRQSGCTRTGSLTGSPRTRRTTPTNRTPTQLGGSGQVGASCMDSPTSVTRMPTSANTVYDMIKNYFRSP